MEDGKLRPAAVGSRMRVNNAEVLVGAAVRGLGIAHLPTWLVHKEIARGELVPVLEGFEAPEAEQGGIYTVRPAARTASAKVQAFTALLRERFGRHPIGTAWPGLPGRDSW